MWSLRLSTTTRVFQFDLCQEVIGANENLKQQDVFVENSWGKLEELLGRWELKLDVVRKMQSGSGPLRGWYSFDVEKKITDVQCKRLKIPTMSTQCQHHQPNPHHEREAIKQKLKMYDFKLYLVNSVSQPLSEIAKARRLASKKPAALPQTPPWGSVHPTSFP